MNVRTRARERKRSTRSQAKAFCTNCTWRNETAGAVGLGALHHDDTGHKVIVEQRLEVTYG